MSSQLEKRHLATEGQYGLSPYILLNPIVEVGMSNTARFDLKMSLEEKEVVARAAALVGTTMAAFVRSAGK